MPRNIQRQAAEQSLAPALRLGSAIVEDVREARQWIEPVAARLAAGAASRRDVARLHQLMAAHEHAVRQGEDTAAVRDREFHRGVADCTGNSAIAVIVKALVDIDRVEATAAVGDCAERVGARDVYAHRRIAEAIERGDADGAADLMHQHLSPGVQPVVRVA